MENKVTIPTYFDTDFCDSASYDNYRKIANYIDGSKLTVRKILWTMLNNRIKNEMKVSQFASKVAQETEYLHGEASICGVTVSIAQDFIGTNNLPLITRGGTFGTRLMPEASASRYIYTCQEDYFEKVFRPEDKPILIGQKFEGNNIEPQYLLPVIPLILVNGSEAISTGFAQKILPRDTSEVISYVEHVLLNKHTKSFSLQPSFNGWTGDVELDENGSWVFSGKAEVVNLTTVKITEIPPQYDLVQYLKVLDKLEDTGMIQGYDDFSDDGKFMFEVKMTKKCLDKAQTKGILDVFKLKRKISENLIVLDENNKINDKFTNVKQIIDSFIKFRLDWYQKRREYLLQSLTQDLLEKLSKFTFIKYVIENGIGDLHKLSDERIYELLDKIKNIIKINDSYDYLLNIPIRSITKSNFDKLKTTIMELKSQIDKLNKTSKEQLWLDDLNELKKAIK